MTDRSEACSNQPKLGYHGFIPLAGHKGERETVETHGKQTLLEALAILACKCQNSRVRMGGSQTGWCNPDATLTMSGSNKSRRFDHLIDTISTRLWDFHAPRARHFSNTYAAECWNARLVEHGRPKNNTNKNIDFIGSRGGAQKCSDKN